MLCNFKKRKTKISLFLFQKAVQISLLGQALAPCEINSLTLVRKRGELDTIPPSPPPPPLFGFFLDLSKRPYIEPILNFGDNLLLLLRDMTS